MPIDFLGESAAIQLLNGFNISDSAGISVPGGSGLYRLQDLFTTDRAAGAVNGTPAEPTGQTRTVTDGNSKLTIASGKLTFATGGVGDGNPGLWYPLETRVLGKIFLFQINETSGNFYAGGYAAQSGVANDGVRLVGTTLQTRDAANPISIGVVAATTDYTFAYIWRASGFYLFIKGGAFTTFTLVWYSVVTGTNQYPGFSANGTTSVFLVDDARIPNATYIPLPLAYDTFTRANGALGSTEAASADAQAITALTWLFTVGIWAVATNRAVGTPVLGADVIVNGGFGADTDWTKGAGWAIAAGLATGTVASSDLTAAVAPMIAETWYTTVYTLSAFAAGTVQAVVGGISYPTHAANATYTESGRAGTTVFKFTGAGFTGSLDNVSSKALVTAELFASVLVSTADVIASVAVTLPAALGGVQAGLVLNLDSTSTPQNYILCYLDGRGNIVLEERVAGVTTVKFTTAITYSAGALLYVIRDGTSCRVLYNFSAVNTVQTMTANTNLNHGLFSTSALNSLDTFNLYARGKANEYAALDIYI